MAITWRTARRRRATGVQAHAVPERPWIRRTPSPDGPPQSRKWIRSPGPTTTTKPSGSAAASGGGTAPIAPRIRAPWPSAAAGPAPAVPAPDTARSRSWSALALDAVPEPFAAALDEVAIVIEDEPTDEQRQENHIAPDETLYGLYEGVPRTEWGADWAAVPNRITLFRLPLEADFADPDDLADEVWVTVVHELAHHLGIDDERLTELGID